MDVLRATPEWDQSALNDLRRSDLAPHDQPQTNLAQLVRSAADFTDEERSVPNDFEVHLSEAQLREVDSMTYAPIETYWEDTDALPQAEVPPGRVVKLVRTEASSEDMVKRRECHLLNNWGRWVA